MKKVLSQEEIDSLIRAARTGAERPLQYEPPAVTLWDGRRGSSRISGRVTESITQMLTQIAEVSLTLETMLVPPAEVQPPHEHGLQVMVVAAGSLRSEMSLAGATNCRSRR